VSDLRTQRATLPPRSAGAGRPLVSQGVVDVLEAVEIDEQEADAASLALRRGESAIGPFGEQQPVGQTRQRVVRRVNLTTSSACRLS